MAAADLKLFHQKYIQFQEQDNKEVFEFKTDDEFTIEKILGDIWESLVNTDDHPSKP